MKKVIFGLVALLIATLPTSAKTIRTADIITSVRGIWTTISEMDGMVIGDLVEMTTTSDSVSDLHSPM